VGARGVSNPTPADRRRWGRFPDIGCVACRMDGRRNPNTQVHHLNRGGMAGRERIGHQATIPLCPYHHQGIPPEPFSAQWARENIGPSLAEGSKPFRERYGNDACLLAWTNEWLSNMDRM
jgi:hypothetical protein